MKKVVLYGAYDRYNFGDNLMPMVFELYCKEKYPEMLDNHEFIYSSISNSDLSKYGCLKTQSINDVIDNLKEGDSIIIVGGEVLCASSFVLYTHMPKPKFLNDVLKFVNKIPYIRILLRRFTNILYHAPWSYPYVPDVNNNIKVIYNTVGGSLKGLSDVDKVDIANRLNNSNIISVRDKRTYNELKLLKKEPIIAPDSVYVISSLCDDDFIDKHINQKWLKKYDKDYIVFQAAPTKVGEDIDLVVDNLRHICYENDCKIILLPIGYAAGHDDYYYLKKINKLMPNETILAYELNVWEILSVIRKSRAYIGTSLHGAIIAMSYAIPHFGLNPGVLKLDSFLNDWSIKPFNRSYSISEIRVLLENIDSNKNSELEKIRNKNIKLVEDNFNEIIKALTKS